MNDRYGVNGRDEDKVEGSSTLVFLSVTGVIWLFMVAPAIVLLPEHLFNNI